MTVVAAPSRPLLRYFGGKWRLAPWIISHFPQHTKYTEAYGGGASVLLRKAPVEQEIYNDLDQELVTLFSVLRSDRAAELVNAIALTPFARAEFEQAYGHATDPVEIARRLIVRSFFGFGGGPSIMRRPTSFRSVNHKEGSAPVQPWQEYPAGLAEAVARLKNVVVENKPALKLLAEQDGPNVLHYIDPPYVHISRSEKSCGEKPYHGYQHEMTDDDHRDLLDLVRDLKGNVVVSGYQNPIYADALSTWCVYEKKARDTSGNTKTEVLWTNFEVSFEPQMGLFDDLLEGSA